jgi:hypothetical protein
MHATAVRFPALSGGSERSDRLGCVRLDPGRDSLRIESRGYLPWLGRLPADSTLRLAPQDGGLLHGVRFALDPGGQGGDPSPPGGGVAAADLAYEICRFLAERLAAGGATAALVRDRATGTSDLERIRVALEQRADWYVRLDLAPQAPAMVLHYPGSAGGERLGDRDRGEPGAAVGVAVPVRSDTRLCCADAVSGGRRSYRSHPRRAWRPSAPAPRRSRLAFASASIRKPAQRPPILGDGGRRRGLRPRWLGWCRDCTGECSRCVPFRCGRAGLASSCRQRIPPSEVRVEVSGNDTTRVRRGSRHPERHLVPERASPPRSGTPKGCRRFAAHDEETSRCGGSGGGATRSRPACTASRLAAVA